MLAGNGGAITGAASTIVRDNISKHVVVVTNNNGKIAASSLTVSSIQGVITGGATTVVGFNLTPKQSSNIRCKR